MRVKESVMVRTRVRCMYLSLYINQCVAELCNTSVHVCVCIYIYINVCAGFEGADEGVLPRTWRESSRGVQGSCQRLPRGSQGLFRTYTRTKEENKTPFCRKSTCLCMCVSVDLLLSHTEIVCACLLTSCVSLCRSSRTSSSETMAQMVLSAAASESSDTHEQRRQENEKLGE